MHKTLFIVNPNAASGRSRKTWQRLEPLLRQMVTPHNYNVVLTRYPEDVDACLTQAAVDRIERVITVGGDGTNFVAINALMSFLAAHPGYSLVYGNIPAGTGRDFARGAGLPRSTEQAAQYVLRDAEVRPIDLGLVQYNGGKRYFLNISSAGISHAVTKRVEQAKKRPWTFFSSIVASLARYEPEAVRLELDGALWYEGRIYIASVANGSYYGQGIHIAPQAVPDDGLFDVVIAEAMSLPQIVRAFPTLYSGQHIHNPHVKCARARHVRVISQHGGSVGMDLDGEPAPGGREIVYTILPGALPMLL